MNPYSGGTAKRRSYAYSLQIRTRQGGANNDPNTGVGARQQPAPVTEFGYTLADVDAEADTVVVVECSTNRIAAGGDGAPNLGAYNGALLTGCDTWKLAGRDPKTTTDGSELQGCNTRYGLPDWKPWQGHKHGKLYFRRRARQGPAVGAGA